MPKNAHPPRGGSKKPAPPPQPDDGLDIVFSNAKGEPKKRSKGANTSTPAAEPSATGKGKGKEAVEAPTEDAAKKPDTRTLIGGASWTGKLPLNMFNEHCQKQKWDKPEYTMVNQNIGCCGGLRV
jgi:ATP-dependent RNA helicase DHX57